jgi:hypothetical protein
VAVCLRHDDDDVGWTDRLGCRQMYSDSVIIVIWFLNF